MGDVGGWLGEAKLQASRLLGDDDVPGRELSASVFALGGGGRNPTSKKAARRASESSGLFSRLPGHPVNGSSCRLLATVALLFCRCFFFLSLFTAAGNVPSSLDSSFLSDCTHA